jgi:hypothetical protein
MADEPLSDDVRDFIIRYIDSVAQVEALLLLRGNAHEGWDVAKTAKRLYASEQGIAEALKRLHDDGLLGFEGGLYRYGGSASPELQTQVDRLAQVYSRNLVAVTNMIHAKPRRIRKFADAFQFRKNR